MDNYFFHSYFRYYGQHWKGFKRHSNSNPHQFNNSATNRSYCEDNEMISDEEVPTSNSDNYNQPQVQDERKYSNHIETNNSSCNVDSSVPSNDRIPLLQ